METNSQDFQAAADEAVSKDLRAASWLVYDHYEFREDGADVYVYAPSWSVGEAEPEWLRAHEECRKELERSYPEDLEFAWELAARRFGVYRHNVEERYAPLNYPDIFLQFAGLADEGPITQEVMEGWVEQYGVLGLQRTAQGRGDPRGGNAESLSNFDRHARDANFVLRLYEAATKPDGPNVEYLREHVMAPEVLPEDVPAPRVLEGKIDGQKINLIDDSELTPRRLQIAAQKMRARTSPKQLKEVALDYVARTVQNLVSSECYPLFFKRKDGSLLQGWGFKSLLGAMYVQLMWLMTATGEEVQRCLWCHNVITFRQPEQPKDLWTPNDRSRGYRTRRDIKFCNNDGKCRAAYNYHNVQKPRKQAEKRQLSYED